MSRVPAFLESPDKHAESDRDLRPHADCACLICGSRRVRRLCSAGELADRQESLRRFHERRLRRLPDGSVPRRALADRVEFTQDYATDIVRCVPCGLVYRSPRPEAGAVARAYRSDRYGEDYLEQALRSRLPWARRKAAALAPFLPLARPPRVVEVGSFVGAFLTAAGERGWDAVGIDPGEEVVGFCRAHRLSVFRGTLPEFPVDPHTMDAVVIWNTFDQLPDPRPTLHAAARLLRPGGVLVLRLPNGAYFERASGGLRRAGTAGSAWLLRALAWNNLLTFPYLYGYTLRTADRLAGEFDFARMRYAPDTLVGMSNVDTARWAAAEERVCKWWCRAGAVLERMWPGDRAALAPWLDLYYRTPAAQQVTIRYEPRPLLDRYARLAGQSADCASIRSDRVREGWHPAGRPLTRDSPSGPGGRF